MPTPPNGHLPLAEDEFVDARLDVIEQQLESLRRRVRRILEELERRDRV